MIKQGLYGLEPSYFPGTISINSRERILYAWLISWRGGTVTMRIVYVLPIKIAGSAECQITLHR